MKKFYFLLSFISILLIPFMHSAAQDGTLDTSFDTDGIVITAVGLYSDAARCVAIQPDGKILAGGYSEKEAKINFALVRYNSDGSIDSSFHDDGMLTTGITAGSDDRMERMILQPDGKIIAVGNTTSAGNYDFMIVRYYWDGALDETFGNEGIVITDIGAASNEAFGVALQPDGKIIVVGRAYNGTDRDFALVRYNADGTLDADSAGYTGFGGDGIVTTAAGSANDRANSVVIRSDGRIVAGGYSHDGTNYHFALICYNSDGSVYNGFGNSGKVISEVKGEITSLALDSDGNIIAGGYDNDFKAARYLSDGVPDLTFGTGGVVTTYLSSSTDYLRSIAIQKDGKIVAAGDCGSPGTSKNFALVRYTKTGFPDFTFGLFGTVITDIGSVYDFCYDVAIQPDGNIVAAGRAASAGVNFDIVVARYRVSPIVLPVELTSFSAEPDGRNVLLKWTTATESNNYGFEIERTENKSDKEWVKAGFVKGAGNSTSNINYSFTDRTPKGNKLIYRLKQIDYNGNSEYSPEAEIAINANPVEFALQQNYPNPFNPSTRIKYGVAEPGRVLLKVFDYLGREVITLVDEFKDAGEYEADFNFSSLASGVYFYNLHSGRYSETRKMILMR